MFFLIAIFMGWAIGTATKDSSRRDEDEDRITSDDNKPISGTRYLLGIDHSRSVLWEIEQKYKYCK